MLPTGMTWARASGANHAPASEMRILFLLSAVGGAMRVHPINPIIKPKVASKYGFLYSFRFIDSLRMP
jgi:hypothetical protein